MRKHAKQKMNLGLFRKLLDENEFGTKSYSIEHKEQTTQMEIYHQSK